MAGEGEDVADEDLGEGRSDQNSGRVQVEAPGIENVDVEDEKSRPVQRSSIDEVPTTSEPQEEVPKSSGTGITEGTTAATDTYTTITLNDRPHTPHPNSSITFLKDGTTYISTARPRYLNSLLAGVGFLELGNAGDFAANVWNDIPVPRFAIGLMALGGTVALGISYFALQDFRLAWRNMRLLQYERRCLREEQQKAIAVGDMRLQREFAARLEMNFRELGTEIVERVIMDTTMGFGAVLVSIGTYMAIGGANPHVYRASNLLSGYIGNTPAALFAIINSIFSFYVWLQARRHGKAAAKANELGPVRRMVMRRARRVRWHTILYSSTALVAGAASLITATRWWGYTILLPCIFLSLFSNWAWRKRLGYSRPVLNNIGQLDTANLVRELEIANWAFDILSRDNHDPEKGLYTDAIFGASILQFLVDNDLFERFCDLLLKDTELAGELFDLSQETIIIDAQTLLNMKITYTPPFVSLGRKCIASAGPAHFENRRRFLLETLGCYLCACQRM